MSKQAIYFNKEDCPEFFKTLKARVNQHFKDRKITKKANNNMRFKTLFMLILYTTPLILMLTGIVTSFWGTILMWSIMGFGMSGIGLSIMHDANHGSYSKKKRTNKALGFLLNYIGGYHINWKIQHNVLHHSFTNIEGFDEDIEKPVMRFSPNQKNKWLFRFQAFYASFFYAILTIYWLIFKDFEQIFKYSKRKLLMGQGISLKKALFQIIVFKTIYIGFTLVLPIMLLDLPWWQTLLGFLLMQVICGLILAFIFQAAHVLNETHFYEADNNSSVENNWAIHQMKTTANFSNNSPAFSWFIGGLNYQIEHHLFPNICHIHYKDISKIVKTTAQEFGIPYLQHKTFFGALKSHFSLLNTLGRAA